jgi:hypothetical protein
MAILQLRPRFLTNALDAFVGAEFRRRYRETTIHETVGQFRLPE